ncbi:MAG: HutD family protein [Proteobacteria bacterium]|nr:HutD family protein [Pseudomonadota bacterium]
MRMTLHPAEGRPATPWKNGKGVTREIAAFPLGATIDTFEWRVSIADVSAGGAFSNFPGIDRLLAALDGTIRLQIGGEAPVTLIPGNNPVAFAGDIPCRADIPDGAARDLNVMTRRGCFMSRMTLVEADGLFRFPENASAVILVALFDLSIRIAETVIALKPLDAVRFDPPLPGEARLHCDRSQAGRKGLYIIALFQERIAMRDQTS